MTSAKGLVSSGSRRVILVDGGGVLRHLVSSPTGMLIDNELREIRNVQGENIDAVIVVEKDTFFQHISSINSFTKSRCCLFVTAKGYPDQLTVDFLKSIRRILSFGACGRMVPFIYIGDLDPHGINIYLNYTKGLERDDLHSCISSLNTLRWGGIREVDINGLGIHRVGIPVYPMVLSHI